MHWITEVPKKDQVCGFSLTQSNPGKTSVVLDCLDRAVFVDKCSVFPDD